MNFLNQNKNGFILPIITVVIQLFLTNAKSETGFPFEIKGSGWLQYGFIGHSTDTINSGDFENKSLYSSGARFTLVKNFSEHLTVNAGLGVLSSHFVNRATTYAGGYSPNNLTPFITEGNFKYSFFKSENSSLYIQGGIFNYIYNPEIKNLGLYLLRGPVYPGLVVSGFETKNGQVAENITGFQLHHQKGMFTQDILLVSETETYPYFDVSPAYVASLNFSDVFRVGAGVNFFHLIPADDSVTNGNHWVYADKSTPNLDTTYLTFPGTKLMINAMLDPKLFFEKNHKFGKEDLKVYCEIALFGLKNTKPYKDTYGDFIHRMPMMAGFNIPTFNYLNFLSLEVEWYGAHFLDDFATFNHTRANIPSPFPTDYSLKNRDLNVTRDNWKWSLNGSKIIKDHYKFTGQIANDHFRPGVFSGYGDNWAPGSESLLNAPNDWAGIIKFAYLF